MESEKRKLTAYLAGAMEAADKLGSKWRDELTPFLEEIGFNVLNPCNFEPEQLKGLRPNRLPDTYTDMHGVVHRVDHWHELKNAAEAHLFNRFLRYMRRIIRYDIGLVENESDVLICLWDSATGKGAGTHAELTSAYLNDIPVYCVAVSDMPAWAKACCTEIFLTFDGLKNRLEKEFVAREP